MAASREAVNGLPSPLRWPSEHGRYFTIIKFVKYDRKNPKTQATEIHHADIILPLPSNLREYYAMQYGDVEFDKLGGVMDTADSVINDYINSGGSTLSDLNWGDIGDNSVELSQALSRRTANFFSNDLGGVIDRVTGTIVNPHITSVFRGVSLREHSLAWKMHAKNQAESNTIRQIRDFIRSAMHPTKKSNFLLNFPDEVYVRFFAEDRPFLNPIFKCVVTSVVSDLGSEGTNAFFKETDEPVIINMELTLKEVEGLTREDFGTTEEPLGEDGGSMETPTSQSGSITGTGSFGEDEA